MSEIPSSSRAARGVLVRGHGRQEVKLMEAEVRSFGCLCEDGHAELALG